MRAWSSGRPLRGRPALAGPSWNTRLAASHGDCWSGNVLWSGGSGWLIDPAAHGGHRETDLAMLALFGAPYLDRILGAYAEQAPLAAGWRLRVPLHQLHPLLVHVCLFGAAYRDAALDAARAVLAGISTLPAITATNWAGHSRTNSWRNNGPCDCP